MQFFGFLRNFSAPIFYTVFKKYIILIVTVTTITLYFFTFEHLKEGVTVAEFTLYY